LNNGLNCILLLALVTNVAGLSGPGAPGGAAATIEARFDSACARGDWRAAKAIDRELMEPAAPQTSDAGTTLARPRGEWTDMGLRDGAVAVDTGSVTAFDVEADQLGNAWVAVADSANTITVYRSTDWGRTWEGRLGIQATSTVTELKLLHGVGDTNFLFLFFLEQSSSGDLWLARARPESLAGDVLPVAVGPDTVDDFSATLDRDSFYYVYCLYANERRATDRHFHAVFRLRPDLAIGRRLDERVGSVGRTRHGFDDTLRLALRADRGRGPLQFQPGLRPAARLAAVPRSQLDRRPVLRPGDSSDRYLAGMECHVMYVLHGLAPRLQHPRRALLVQQRRR
jgi:hypothetical protein